jgi:hypothetical protein
VLDLANRRELVSFSPGGAERFELRDYLIGALLIFGKRERFAAREFEEFVVAQRLCDAEGGIAMLARAEKLSRAALLQIALGYLETI